MLHCIKKKLNHSFYSADTPGYQTEFELTLSINSHINTFKKQVNLSISSDADEVCQHHLTFLFVQYITT